ncbi:MAG: diguanylate cyclase [Rhodococcus sp. (in: high G+C Gram-positive bacteria)]|nr:MAG: diguanylate cyclase [Rhodococcus sp. (in: high G+C Gram-positive bacteria)]
MFRPSGDDEKVTPFPTTPDTATTPSRRHQSFRYLTEDVVAPPMELVDESARVSTLDLGLDDAQEARAAELTRSCVVISLHDHPQILPTDLTRLREYFRHGRPQTAYSELHKAGITAVFDNLQANLGIVSRSGRKWDDVVAALGLQIADIDHQPLAVVARSVSDILRAHQDGKTAFVLGMESAHAIENEVDRIDILYGLGIRQMGIAYSDSNALGSGLKEVNDGGLTALGRRAVSRMNDIGIAIDVSHSSDRTGLDTIEVSEKPVFITHAGARGVWPSPRMKPDELLKACAESGGVMGITASPHQTISPAHTRHTLESVMDHFSYAIDIMGIEHVAFGPDTMFGDHVALHGVLGLNTPEIISPPGAPSAPTVKFVDGAENPAEFFVNAMRWLVKHGFSDEEIQAVMGGNILKALERVWISDDSSRG